MHRTIGEEDIITFSTGALKKDVRAKKEEDIEYRSGKLYHSTGNATVKVLSKYEDDVGFLSVSAAYNLELRQCYTLPNHTYTRHRRSVSGALEDSKEDSLLSSYNQCKLSIRNQTQLTLIFIIIQQHCMK